MKSVTGARSSTFEVSPDGLRIRGDTYGRLIPTSQLVADSLLLSVAEADRLVAQVRALGK